MPNLSAVGASFLITLREGLEVSLVLAILIAYLVQTNRRHETGAVWRGAALAVLMCLVVGWIIFSATGGLHGTAEQVVEGAIALVAAAVLTWMIFWMRTNARTLGAELRDKVDAATTVRALALVAFVATVREGLETALFLLSAETDASSGAQVVIGGLLGLAVAAVLGWIVYRGGSRLNLRRFFQITGILLILFAAERATWMALEAIQCLGGNGYINDYPTGRLLRDAKLYEIGAGTSEIRRMLIGRELFAETA